MIQRIANATYRGIGRHPTIFLVGAPKCGTSSLANWLNCHSSLSYGRRKETHYYASDLRIVGQVRSYKQYISNFEHLENEKAIDASTTYLYSHTAIPKIVSVVDDPRFIVILRDPVEMVESLHLHNLRNGYENVANFRRAWDLQGERAHSSNVPKYCPDKNLVMYKDICSIGTQTSRLCAQVPSDKVHLISFDQLRHHPRVVYFSCLQFLDLIPEPGIEFTVSNQKSGTKNRTLEALMRRIAGGVSRVGIPSPGIGLMRANRRAAPESTVSTDDRDMLAEAFAQERMYIRELLGGGV